MKGKDIYILLMLSLLCWPRPAASLATPCCFIDDALLALLGLTTETQPTHNTSQSAAPLPRHIASTTAGPAALAALLDTFHLMQPHIRSVLERCVQSIVLAVYARRITGSFLESAQSAIRREQRHLTKTHLTLTTDLDGGRGR